MACSSFAVSCEAFGEAGAGVGGADPAELGGAVFGLTISWGGVAGVGAGDPEPTGEGVGGGGKAVVLTAGAGALIGFDGRISKDKTLLFVASYPLLL